MKSLPTFLKEYLEVRRALGFKLVRAEKELNQFLRFSKRKKSSIILSHLALEWATNSGSASQGSGSKRLAYVKQFALYVSAEDSRHEVPSQHLAPPPPRYRKPVYIYSEEEILKLMKATSIFKSSFKAQTYRTLIGLLFSTGMRIGELIALNDDDFDYLNELITIHNSKDGQSRKIILHSSTIKELKRYQKLKDQLMPRGEEALFVTDIGKRLYHSTVHWSFVELLKAIGLYDQKPRPRIHDIRHSFIIQTIQRWYHEKKNVEAKLSYLSTYVGHVSPSSTYWYLSATPELMACAAKLLNKKMGVLK